MLFDAIEFAARAHAGQYRKASKIPYLVHPLKVAEILIQHGCAQEVVIAGLLHDTIEDTPIAFDTIAEQFGNHIAELVQAVTEPEKTESWHHRKQHTIETLKTAPNEVLQIALADKLDNIRSIRAGQAKIGAQIWHRFRQPREQQKWYYQTLAEIFRSRASFEMDGLVQEFIAEITAVFGDD